jgi:TolB-like protein
MSLWRELQRRKVFRIGAAYLVAGWVVIQVAATVAPQFGLPDWTPRLVTFLVMLGFPLALVLAWALEFGEDGVRLDRSGPGSKRFYVVAVLMAVLAAGWYWRGQATSSPTASPAPVAPVAAVDSRSVAVLPFVAMSQSAEDGFFADGLSEEIINALTTLPDLLVTARTSTFHFKGREVPVPEIARTLGVANVVEGSVRRAGDNLRVSAQLIRASDGFHLWSQSYDRPVADIFAVQADIAANVARALDVVLDAKKREGMLASGTRNVEAFLAYRRAMQMLDDWHATDRRSGKMWDALALLDQATALDPNFMMAQVDSADPYTHFLMGHIPPPPGGMDAATALAQVRAKYDRAFDAARDPDQRLWLDLERQVFAERWDRVPGLMAQLQQRIAAGKQFNMIWLSDLMTVTGHARDYLGMVEAGAKLNPLDREQRGKAALAAEALGDYARAERLVRESIAQVGRTGLITEAEILMELDRGRPERALAICAELEPTSTARSYLPVAQAAVGDIAGARQSLAALEAEGERPVLLILPHFQLGDLATANRIAAEVDARPLGSLELLGEVASFGGRLPFDPSVAPNFVRRMQEAGAPTRPLQPFKPN